MGTPLAALGDENQATPFASDAAAGAGSDALLRLLATLSGGARPPSDETGSLLQGFEHDLYRLTGKRPPPPPSDRAHAPMLGIRG